MLVSSDHESRTVAEDSKFSLRSVLAAVGRRSLPHLLEATLIPALLFYLSLIVFGPIVAMTTVLVWTYGAVLRRVVRGRRIPGVLMLATIGLTVRTIVGLLTGSTFMYLHPTGGDHGCALGRVPRLGPDRPPARRATRFRLLPDRRRRGEPARCGASLQRADVAVGRDPFGERGHDVRTAREPPGHDVRRAKTGRRRSRSLSAGSCSTVTWAIRTARSENLIFAPVLA